MGFVQKSRNYKKVHPRFHILYPCSLNLIIRGKNRLIDHFFSIGSISISLNLVFSNINSNTSRSIQINYITRVQSYGSRIIIKQRKDQNYKQLQAIETPKFRPVPLHHKLNMMI